LISLIMARERINLPVVSKRQELNLLLDRLGVPVGALLDDKTSSTFMDWLGRANWLREEDGITQLRAGHSMLRERNVLRPVELRLFQNPFGIYSGTVKFLRPSRHQSGGNYFSFWAVEAGWRPGNLFWGEVFEFMEERFAFTDGSQAELGCLLDTWRFPLKHMSQVVNRASFGQSVVILTGGDIGPDVCSRLRKVGESRFWGGVSNLAVGAVSSKE